MPSILHNFEYDIFISYRHKDNKYDGWVTEFVANLKKEIEATFKEDISIYFDANPHNGLLETHDVDDSLKEKLKCLIFIPIISQTYCDPKSFAWASELLPFVKMASEDSLGLKIKLLNSNTASRVLPIRIHELDFRDKKLLEDVLGPLRAIDFTYQSAGVNRPLRQKDDEAIKGSNQNIYRDQLNKTANAIKEIIAGIQGKDESQPPPLSFQKKAVDSSFAGNKIRTKRTFQMPGYKTLFGLSAALALFLIVVLIEMAITGKSVDAPIATNLKTSILLPDSIPLTFMAGPLGGGMRGLEISPDGKLIAFVHMKPGKLSCLYVRAIDDYNITTLPGTDGAFAPIFSPDSKWIAFFANDKLMKISVDGNLKETLTQTANAYDGIWGEDDRITWIGNDGYSLNTINSNGKDYNSVSTNGIGSRPARISPDEFLTSNEYGEIHLISFSKGIVKRVLSGGSHPTIYNNELFFIKGNDLLSVGLDRSKVEIEGTPTLIERNVSAGFYGQYSISTEGTLVFVNGAHSSMGKLTWKNISGGQQALPIDENIFGTFTLSPNGKYLAIVEAGTEIWKYNLERPEDKIVISKNDINSKVFTIR